MSRWRRHLQRQRDDGGFSLAEIIVAIALVALSAAGAVPLLIAGMDAALTARLNAQAKNLTQERLESMRDLNFHVDRQNGPFVDLLDIYYTNLSTTTSTRTRAGETEVGHWVSGGASSPHPSGAFYQVVVSQVPSFTRFSQTIDTQFLDGTGAAVSTSILGSYDSQVAGKDDPPSLMVGVTVTTSWTSHGHSHSFTSYTRIADSRGSSASVTSQASAEFLRVSSTGLSANALTVDLATAQASGGLTTGSDAAADVSALDAVDASGSDYTGATGVATSPTGSTSVNSPVSAFSSGMSGSCGWVGIGPSQVSDVTAATTSGLPLVPSDVDTASPPLHQVAAQLTSGSNGCNGIFNFSNQSTSYASNLMLDSGDPLVQIPNDTANNIVVTGSAWVNATSAATTTHSVTSGANTSGTKRVRLFPGAEFIGDGKGLLDITLTQATLSCASNAASGSSTSSSAGSWKVDIDYWKSTDSSGGGTRVTVPTYTWSSSTGSGSADPLASLLPSNITVYQNGTTTLKMSDYISSWSTARSIVENANSGLHQLSGIVSVTTQPVRDSDVTSTVALQVGNLACVASDQR